MTADAPWPVVRRAEDPRRPHLLHAGWGFDRKGAEASMRFWRTSDACVLQDVRANAETRGRTMVAWLHGLGHPVTVVEVIPQAVGFWTRMLDEGLVERWQAASGRPHPLERLAIPWDDLVATPSAGVIMMRRRIAACASQGVTERQRAAIAGAPPHGYGRILHADGAGRPTWVDVDDIVARHLPMGLSKRRAGDIATWTHPFRLRADHPRYQEDERTC